MCIVKTIGARIGLLGNPSDGFHGKTLASLIANFCAQVWLEESDAVCIAPDGRCDAMTWASLDELRSRVQHEGYPKEAPLLLATCKKFVDVCESRDIRLPPRNFTIGYSTSIPLQVGLAGSSAIVVGALQAMMEFYGVGSGDIPLAQQPSVALAVETEELGVPAGLQDRVTQVYGGLVYMDFDREYMARWGCGRYEKLDLSVLPPLYLAYDKEGVASGNIHGPIRALWARGDRRVMAAMATLAQLAERGKEALLSRDHEEFGRLMDQNFDTRLALYGEEALGSRNLRMVRIGRSLGLPAKFAGSGGAVIGICPPERQDGTIKRFAEEGFECCVVNPVEMV